MRRETDFRMRINEIFHFNNGQSVLVGPVEVGPERIPAQMCEIVMDGERRQLIRIEGEMIPLTANREERSVATTDSVLIEQEDLKQHVLVLQTARGEKRK